MTSVVGSHSQSLQLLSPGKVSAKGIDLEQKVRRKAFRHLGVVTLVLGGHVLVISFLLSSGPWDRRRGLAQTEPPLELVLLNLESTSERPRPEQAGETAPASGVGRAHIDRPRKDSRTAPSEPSGEAGTSTAISPDETGVIPRTDWQRELEISVETVMPGMIKEYTRLCDEAERAHAPRPLGCNRRSFDGPWRPSGNLLQDMRDPDRPHSSVPDPLPEAFPKAPRPDVFRNDH
jgi:hypothetical protein